MGCGFEGEGGCWVVLLRPLGDGDGVGDGFVAGEEDCWDSVGFLVIWGEGWWGGAGMVLGLGLV